MQRETITRRTLARWTAWAAAAGIAGAQGRPQRPSQLEDTAQLENAAQLKGTAARQPDARAARSLDSFEVPRETEPAFVFQP
jgi:hypothetical protein